MDYVLIFMEGILFKGYVEVVLFLELDDECWYLLIFVIYYLKKLNKIRMVFDFFVLYEGILLNLVLFLGLDLINNLLGVFFCFCKERIVLMVDIE